MDMYALLDRARDLLYAVEDESATEGSIGLDAYRVRKAIDHMRSTTPTQYTCEECGWVGIENQTHFVSGIHARVQTGEFMPAGECPACAELIGAADQDIPDYTLEDAIRIARQRGMLKGE